MIRLLIKDTICDSLDDLKALLNNLSLKEEKDDYHISLAEKFRSGILKQWLSQEKIFMEKKGMKETVSELESLLVAVDEDSDNLETDRDIYSWMMNVFCNQLSSSVYVNPFRYLSLKECVLRFVNHDSSITGCFVFSILQEAKERFGIYLELNGNKVLLTTILAKGQKGIEIRVPFTIQTSMNINQENIRSAKVLIDGTPFNASDIRVETNIPDIFIRSLNGELHLCKKIDSRLRVMTRAVFQRIGPFNEQGVSFATLHFGGNCFLFKDGRILDPYRFKKAWLVGDGMAALLLEYGDKVIFVNRYGNVLCESSHTLTDMRTFSEGFLVVQRASGEWGYMSKDGVIVGSYANAHDFKGGRAFVYRNGFLGIDSGWKVINRDFLEKETDEQQYWDYHTESPTCLDGMEVKKSNGKWGLFTKNDHFPVPITYGLSRCMDYSHLTYV